MPFSLQSSNWVTCRRHKHQHLPGAESSQSRLLAAQLTELTCYLPLQLAAGSSHSGVCCALLWVCIQLVANFLPTAHLRYGKILQQLTLGVLLLRRNKVKYFSLKDKSWKNILFLNQHLLFNFLLLLLFIFDKQWLNYGCASLKSMNDEPLESAGN